MRKYETPKMNTVEIEATDIIQTSGILKPGGNATIPGEGVVVPVPPTNN